MGIVGNDKNNNNDKFKGLYIKVSLNNLPLTDEQKEKIYNLMDGKIFDGSKILSSDTIETIQEESTATSRLLIDFKDSDDSDKNYFTMMVINVSGIKRKALPRKCVIERYIPVYSVFNKENGYCDYNIDVTDAHELSRNELQDAFNYAYKKHDQNSMCSVTTYGDDRLIVLFDLRRIRDTEYCYREKSFNPMSVTLMTGVMNMYTSDMIAHRVTNIYTCACDVLNIGNGDNIGADELKVVEATLATAISNCISCCVTDILRMSFETKGEIIVTPKFNSLLQNACINNNINLGKIYIGDDE